MNFLNDGKGYTLFLKEAQKDTYVDKSMLIDMIFRYSRKTNQYICVTKPRRFGKSTAANMVAAFFDKSTAKESRKLFENLDIGRLKEEQKNAVRDGSLSPLCWAWQGKKNVIRINLINLITEKINNYMSFQDYLNKRLIDDILSVYPSVTLDEYSSVPEALLKTGDHFIFVIDEWDSIFEMNFMTEVDKKQYILFLKALLKDQPYVDFVYMTGILPIAKYSSGSPLNMFTELSSFEDDILYPYFGLTNEEIEKLIQKNGYSKPTPDELKFWYDGYIRGYDGEHMYNPASVSKALAGGVCRNFWTGTGPMNEVTDIIRNNVSQVRDDVIHMAAGETIDVELTGFSVEKNSISTRDEILSAMVVYGFLTYFDKKLKIPNHELMLKFRQTLASEPLGLKQTLDESKKLLDATLDRRHNDIAQYLEELHNEKIPFFKYSDENSLACVVTIGYLSALDKYRILRENKAGKGYVDFLFIPVNKNDTAIILELKYNHSAKNAIKCIHERDYIKGLKGYKRVLLVGINYSEKTKKHTCLTEMTEQGS